FLDDVATLVGQCLVDRPLQRNLPPATHLRISRQDQFCADVDYALVQTACGEPAKYHRMGQAQPRASLHDRDGLDRHVQVDDGAVALPVSHRFDAIGYATDPGEEFAVGDGLHRTVVRLKDDGRLVAVSILDVNVKAVFRDVELTVLEPGVEGRIGFIKDLG